MTSIGFTGTREGMALHQQDVIRRQLTSWLSRPGNHEWHDGDCKGADDEAHCIVEGLKDKGYNIRLVGHPCTITQLQIGNKFDDRREVKKPLVRNEDIVNESDVILATPKEFNEQFIGSGTWATIRYTIKMGKPILIVFPDGTLKALNGFTLFYS